MNKIMIWRSRPPQMLPAPLQHEALRVTREALSNAIQHAQAQQIVVELVDPALPDQSVQLIIRDDGQDTSSVRLRAGH